MSATRVVFVLFGYAMTTSLMSSSALHAKLLLGDPPVVTCTSGDTLSELKATVKTCVVSEPSRGVIYEWIGEGLVNGKNDACAEWDRSGLKYVYVTDTIGGGRTVCVTAVTGTSRRMSGVAVLPEMPKPQTFVGNLTGGATSRAWLDEVNVRLSDPYPNPFNPVTVISYDLPAPSHVKLSVHDVLGRNVAILVDEVMPAGLHSFSWDASAVPGGVYFCVLEAAAAEHPRSAARLLQKVVLMK